MGKDPFARTSSIRTQHPQATDQHRHFWRAEGEKLGTVYQKLLSRNREIRLLIIAEPIGGGFHNLERSHIGVLLAGIHPPWGERNDDRVTGFGSSLLNPDRACQNDQIRQRDLLIASSFRVETSLNSAQMI